MQRGHDFVWRGFLNAKSNQTRFVYEHDMANYKEIKMKWNLMQNELTETNKRVLSEPKDKTCVEVHESLNTAAWDNNLVQRRAI